MTRHERRKAARARKEAKDALFISRFIHEKQETIRKHNLSRAKSGRRSEHGMGNRGIYQAIGMWPAPGFGEGYRGPEGLNDRTLAKLQSQYGKPKG